MVRNGALRKAAGSPQPPQLTDDEVSLIRKKFAPGKPVTSYTRQGNIQQQEIGTGRNIDTRV